MRFHGAPRHFELSSDFVIVAALQEQLDNLLFTLPQTYSLFTHSGPPSKKMLYSSDRGPVEAHHLSNLSPQGRERFTAID